MEARWLALKNVSEKKLAEICQKLEDVVPPITKSVGTAGSNVLQGLVEDLNRVRCDMENLLVSTRNRKNEENTDSCFDDFSEVTLADTELLSADESRGAESGQATSFFKDTMIRIRNRLDETYQSDSEVGLDANDQLHEMARLINNGRSDDALKLIIKNSKNIEDVLHLSAAALDLAGGVSDQVKNQIRHVDYVSMCAKFASSTSRRNNNITYIVDHILYEGLLDGKIYLSDFSDKFEPLEDLVTTIDEDQDTINENARHFLDLLTKTLLPATSVILKVAAMVALFAACITPLTAGLLCASAVALDTMTQVLKSRFMCDVLMTFMATAGKGEALNEALSNAYVKKISSTLLHETITGCVKICHNLFRGDFYK